MRALNIFLATVANRGGDPVHPGDQHPGQDRRVLLKAKPICYFDKDESAFVNTNEYEWKKNYFKKIIFRNSGKMRYDRLRGELIHQHQTFGPTKTGGVGNESEPDFLTLVVFH